MSAEPAYCPTCGAPRTLWSSDDGTSSFAPPPILRTIFDALREHGWEIKSNAGSFPGGLFVDPEGNQYGNLESAVAAQTFREIAAS